MALLGKEENVFNTCYCGSQASYPHSHDCPYPLFRASEREEDKWLQARADLRADVDRIAADKAASPFFNSGTYRSDYRTGERAQV